VNSSIKTVVLIVDLEVKCAPLEKIMAEQEIEEKTKENRIPTLKNAQEFLGDDVFEKRVFKYFVKRLIIRLLNY